MFFSIISLIILTLALILFFFILPPAYTNYINKKRKERWEQEKEKKLKTIHNETVRWAKETLNKLQTKTNEDSEAINKESRNKEEAKNEIIFKENSEIKKVLLDNGKLKFHHELIAGDIILQGNSRHKVLITDPKTGYLTQDINTGKLYGHHISEFDKPYFSRYLKEESTISENEITIINSRYIPKNVRDAVWRRAQGKCENYINDVRCNSQTNLEFDHIIPISKGGSNSYRNVQLLCEKCNREKSNKIG